MDTNSFIVYIKTEDIYEDIAKVVDSRYDTSNYKLNRLLPKGKKIGLMKDGLSGKMMKEFAALRGKSYSCLIDNTDEDKKSKTNKKVYHKMKT